MLGPGWGSPMTEGEQPFIEVRGGLQAAASARRLPANQ
jgi:hypothetical protein